jgi:hypothetical protein
MVATSRSHEVQELGSQGSARCWKSGVSHLGLADGGNRSRRLLTARTLAGLYRSAWTGLVLADGHRLGSQPPRLDLVLADGQRFGSQPWIALQYKSCTAADGVILQLERLAGDFNELPSIVGPKPADVIKARRRTPGG